MPQYVDEMKDLILDKVKRGTPFEKVIRHLKRGLKESAELWERGADEKRERHAGVISESIAREIEFLDLLATNERERIEDIEALTKSGWKGEPQATF